ncbi:MAG: hypothetical protein ACRDGI_05185, partial [Candidatus Limnocylindrales bacterium]
MIAVTIDVGELSLAAIRSGALAGQPVAVLGLARSGLALARYLADAGAAVTIYDGKREADLAGAIAQLEGRPVRLMLGPETDPAEALRGMALVTTSPAISADFPTTEPRLRGALQALAAARAAGDAGAAQ